MNKLYLFFYLLSFFLGISNAQDKPITFDRFSTKDGLSQNRIFDIIQDDLGFIWFGTEDGLNRYDGYNFKIIMAVNGQEAIDKCTEHHPNLILMDMKMPILNGYEATEKIKKENNITEGARSLSGAFINWLIGILLIYSSLFAIGKIIFKDYILGFSLLIFSVALFAVMSYRLTKE